MSRSPENARPTGSPPLIEKVSLSSQIYLSIREGIILGRYPQGSRLTEQRLAQEFEVSRIPLREAVPLLEMHGFVRTFPRRGAVVATWDAKAVNDLFDLRLCLEVGATRYAARQVAAGAPTHRLEQVLAETRRVVHERDPYGIAAASAEFHEAVVDQADNALMTTLMQSILGRMVWLFYLTSQLDVDDAFSDHVELCEAIISGNERVAEALAYAHIERDREPSFAALSTLHALAEDAPPD
ncbi:GntR family transcriptional regulator [Nakamurella sp. PAMC28650]|jgi:DNA-binding GntR family transcriptional regulator|uniref:GntR family transcriptional regulator n=1 Tax=Nakamurella sp. PAMC28650 TaxID=2762325 RepID=UPI00164DC3A0|nr:GntR family transcriptional regulator [Nakamurella sp. PAMC28650]QNK83297.1 GntR family transcriptional regulator [Nakamurella sp. PAMC28650]